MTDDEKRRAAVARLGEILDGIDAQTRLPGEPSLRSAVAEHAREELAARRDECDAPNAPSYLDGTCRCLVCARCGHHTGNSTQGHYWSFCKVTRTMREHHFCCPDDCELGNAP